MAETLASTVSNPAAASMHSVSASAISLNFPGDIFTASAPTKPSSAASELSTSLWSFSCSFAVLFTFLPYWSMLAAHLSVLSAASFRYLSYSLIWEVVLYTAVCALLCRRVHSSITAHAVSCPLEASSNCVLYFLISLFSSVCRFVLSSVVSLSVFSSSWAALIFSPASSIWFPYFCCSCLAFLTPCFTTSSTFSWASRATFSCSVFLVSASWLF